MGCRWESPARLTLRWICRNSSFIVMTRRQTPIRPSPPPRHTGSTQMDIFTSPRLSQVISSLAKVRWSENSNAYNVKSGQNGPLLSLEKCVFHGITEIIFGDSILLLTKPILPVLTRTQSSKSVELARFCWGLSLYFFVV